MSARDKDPAIQATHGLGKADEPQRELPANVDAEQSVLGQILNDNRCFDRISSFLEEEHFHEKLHQKIYFVCGELIRTGKQATPISVKTFLPAKGTIGDMTMVQYLARLASDATGAFAVRENAIAVHEAWIARQAISAATDFLDFCFDPPPGVEVVGERTDLEDRLAQLRGLRVKSETRRGAGQQYIDNMNGVRQRGDVPGIPIALEEIQRVISEPTFELGNYYGLLSSSGEGKSSLTVQLVYHALANGCAVQFQSFDQSAEQIVRQMVAQRYKIEARRQRFGDLKEGEWLEASLFAKWLDEQAFEVIECTHEGAPQLVGYARNFKRRRAGDRRLLIVTDHVNAVMPEKSTERADEGSKAAAINSILKAGAKSVNAAWLVLNQRNTKGMQRDNPRPIASDLYGGEGAKRAYDAVFFLYRYKKFYAERCAIASKDADWKIINKVFPSAVREGKDIADIGACKVRFGDPSIRETLDFNARFTLLESIAPALDQDEMSFIKAMG
jgi:replicative DNA helicase